MITDIDRNNSEDHTCHCSGVQQTLIFLRKGMIKKSQSSLYVSFVQVFYITAAPQHKMNSTMPKINNAEPIS